MRKPKLQPLTAKQGGLGLEQTRAQHHSPLDSTSRNAGKPPHSGSSSRVTQAGRCGHRRRRLHRIECRSQPCKRRVSTLVLERAQIGFGASSRNAGMLLPGVKASLKEIANRYDLAFTSQLWQWTLDSIEFVSRLTQAESIPCDWRSSGSLELAETPKQEEALRHRLDFFLQGNLHYEKAKLVIGANLQTEIDSPKFRLGLLDHSAASLNPYKYLAGLAQRAEHWGADIREQSRVLGLRSRKHRGVSVQLAGQSIQCDKVLLASNGHTSWRFPGMRKNLLPVGSYIIATEPCRSNSVDTYVQAIECISTVKKFLTTFV